MVTIMGRVVPVRLDDELLRLVDELVRLGIYKSRSEALRSLIRIGARHVKQIDEIARAVDMLFELEKEEGDIPIKLNGSLKQLLIERERFKQ
jgi:Arc/MetJ-type ribon-helix-helix transcriptional regulator